MGTTFESETIEGKDSQNTSDIVKKKSNIKSFNFFNLRNNKLNKSKHKNINMKKVKFNKDIAIIDVESWKKYNVELTSGECEEELDEKNNDNKKEKGPKDKNIKNNKKEHISCVCLII